MFQNAELMSKGLARLDKRVPDIGIDDDVIGVRLDGTPVSGSNFFRDVDLRDGLPRIGRFQKETNVDAFKRFIKDCDGTGQDRLARVNREELGMVLANPKIDEKELETFFRCIDELRVNGNLPRGIYDAADTPESSRLLRNMMSHNKEEAVLRGYVYEGVATRNVTRGNFSYNAIFDEFKATRPNLDKDRLISLGQKHPTGAGRTVECDAFFRGSTQDSRIGIDFKRGASAAPSEDEFAKAVEALQNGQLEQFFFASPDGNLPGNWVGRIKAMNDTLNQGQTPKRLLIGVMNSQGIPAP